MYAISLYRARKNISLNSVSLVLPFRLLKTTLECSKVFLPFYLFSNTADPSIIYLSDLSNRMFLKRSTVRKYLTVKTLTSLNNKDPLLERLGTNLMVTTKIMTIVETIGEED